MRSLLLLPTLVVLALAPACHGGGAGAGGAPPDAGADAAEAGACNGPPVPGKPACEACQAEKCCLTASNCAKNPDCVAIETCLGDGGASAGCVSGHTGGVWDQSGLDVCRQNRCAAECGVAPATCGAIVPDPASCLAAVDMACCQETAACGASDDCVALIYQCLDKNGCGTSGPCFDNCRAMYPGAQTVFDAMAACWGNVSC